MFFAFDAVTGAPRESSTGFVHAVGGVEPPQAAAVMPPRNKKAI
jgi:hypothetical protein